MGVREEASKIHEQGFNCAQSVLCACGKYTGMDDATALAVSAGFGGGVRCGEICGAVSGAIMALGLATADKEGNDRASMQKTSRLTAAFTRDFSERFGCIRCIDLKRSGHPCAELIEYAAQQAEAMLTKDNE